MGTRPPSSAVSSARSGRGTGRGRSFSCWREWRWRFWSTSALRRGSPSGRQALLACERALPAVLIKGGGPVGLHGEADCVLDVCGCHPRRGQSCIRRRGLAGHGPQHRWWRNAAGPDLLHRAFEAYSGCRQVVLGEEEGQHREKRGRVDRGDERER